MPQSKARNGVPARIYFAVFICILVMSTDEGKRYFQRICVIAPKRKSKVPACDCKKTISVARNATPKLEFKDFYSKFLTVVKCVHTNSKHKRLVSNGLETVIEYLQKPTDTGIFDEIVLTIPDSQLEQMLDKLAKNESWQICEDLLRRAKSTHWLSNDTYIDCIRRLLLSKKLCGAEVKRLRLLNMFLQHGDMLPDRKVANCVQKVLEYNEYRVVRRLIEAGVNPQYLTLQKGDTPYHAAFTIALYKDEGNFDLCKLLLDMHDQFPHKYQFLDPKKDTSAFGLVLTAYDSVHALDAIDILQLHRFSTDVGHSCGHTSINRQNERSDSPPNCNRNKITDTLQNQASLEPKRKAEKHSESVDPACLDLKKQIYCPQTFREKTPDKDENIVQTKPLKPKVFSAQSETPKIELKISQSITRSIKQKSADVPQPLHPERNLREELSSLIKALQASPTAQVGCHQMSKTEMALNIEDGTVGDVDADTNMVKDLEEDSENEDLKDEKCFDDVKFADLEWEVECTDDVCKMMLQRQLTPTLKERVVRRVKLLASGEWRHSLCKRIPTTDKTVRLFEAKLSKAARILWEPAIDVSGRIQPDFGYNESRKTKAIYTEIIRIWDIVLDHDKIHHSKVRIERAHKKGRGSKLTKRMKGVKDRQFEGGLKQRRPMLFFENDDRSGLDGGDDLLYPLASINGNASNILLFYDFDSLVTRALAPNSKDSHVEIPFRPKFNDNFQLSLPVNSPIILQGRSGTGKTTYCLYRMWDCFQDYWKQAVGTTVTRLCDPMRQLFLTRNQVLCSEMQKVFNAYCRGTHFAYKHVEEEGRPLPPRLQEVDAYRYPLFLTLRQLLLMLDASLPRHFFERTTDGSLKFPIPGWGEEKDIFAYIPLDDDWSDDENVGLENISGKGYKFQADTAKETKKRSNSGEVTFDVFANEIWPKLRNKTQMSTCLPILIWTEITSFIKGSEHALTKGFLDKDSYIKVGRKQATNFTVNDREKIYDIFVLYEKYKKDHGYYDECDLVSHIYGRLVKNHHSQLWRFHHIYVDESQDFTQAEMALFIKLSLNTNNMFFTGDSAQSIMHGVSFRFCDLKTLLFNDWKSKPQHKTGKEFQVDESVHQLVHSYRSHTGILSLASGIIDLLKDLFPNSIDNLCRDQGIFDGPKPVLIQSEVLKPHDLASVMRGTLRKNSKINFGARQVILVANDKSKNTLPEELRKARVLTIYESKGLEFDDVLLYNFFKDSQASREWRVVTNCLRKVKLPENHKGQLHPPRPVEFDHDLHKMLNSELKQLYTAITRARFHLWIYDEDTEKRAPMFYYIEARDLAKLNDTEDKWEDNLEDVPQSEEMERLEWNDEGDKMMQRKLYSEAAKCYHNAGLEHKESVANAYQRGTDALQLSGQSSRTEYLQVALLFLKCYLEIQTCTIDILKPREILARNVCTFLGKARELDLAAQMYRKIGLLEPALKLYTRLQKWKTISRIYATMGDLHRAVQILDEREMYEEAIGCIERYQDNGPKITGRKGNFDQNKKCLMNLKVKDATPLRSKVDCINDDLVRGLSDRAAAFYCRHKQPENALKSVRLLPEEEQLRCLQSHGYYAHDNTLMNSVSTR